jgi:hypothetical protein
LITAWIATMVLLAFKHRQDLRQPPRLRDRWQAKLHHE